MSNSAKYSELGHPFGYLKASTALNCVNLFVMPYNYPVLLPLLGESFSSCSLWPSICMNFPKSNLCEHPSLSEFSCLLEISEEFY